MDLAEFGFHRIGSTYDSFGIRHIERVGDGAHAQCGDFRARPLKCIGLDVGQCDVCAGTRERPADAKANAVRRTRDKGDPAADVLHVENSEVTSLRGALRATSVPRETAAALSFSQ